MPRYSIAEARNRFAEIVRDLKHVARVEVTRRGRIDAYLKDVVARAIPILSYFPGLKLEDWRRP